MPKFDIGVVSVGGWVGRNVPSATQFADILLLTLNYTSPPSLIKIGLILPKFLVRGGFWVGGDAGEGGRGGLNMG